MTSLTGRPCWVPPPRAATNNKWDFVHVIVWLIDQGALGAGDFLVMDNARIHHAADSAQIVDGLMLAIGARLLFLPAYSPELNPCEFVFGYVKEKMSRERGSWEMWHEALAYFSAVTFPQMDAWYRHCIMAPIADVEF